MSGEDWAEKEGICRDSGSVLEMPPLAGKMLVLGIIGLGRKKTKRV